MSALVLTRDEDGRWPKWLLDVVVKNLEPFGLDVSDRNVFIASVRMALDWWDIEQRQEDA